MREMSSRQQQEYLQRQAEEARRQQKATRRQKVLTPEEAAARWRFWRNTAIFAVAALVVGYTAWSYLSPWIFGMMFPVKLPDTVTIEDVVAEFNDDAEAAARKYTGKRIVVEGNLLLGQEGKTKGILYYSIPGDKEGEETQVVCEFFDTDDAQGVDPGEHVCLAGLIKKVGPREFRLEGASSERR
jgi:hypothetical protein